MNSVRKLIKFLIDIFLLNISLIISIFLKYDQIEIQISLSIIIFLFVLYILF